jgi:hypothetical protein
MRPRRKSRFGARNEFTDPANSSLSWLRRKSVDQHDARLKGVAA